MPRAKTCILGLLLSAALLLAALPALAGSPDSGALAGLVSDTSGAPLSGVTVKAVRESTGDEFVAITQQDGRYIIRDLPIGLYTIVAAKEGFQNAVRRDFRVIADQILQLPIKMSLGAEPQSRKP